MALVTRYLKPPSFSFELLQTADKRISANPQVKHRSEVHISTDTGKTVIVKYLHFFLVFLTLGMPPA
jgi:hypothetical protein